MIFPIRGFKKHFELTDAMLAKLVRRYPKVDVASECEAARQWLFCNPEKQLAEHAVRVFLGRWLSRVSREVQGEEQECGPSISPVRKPSEPTPIGDLMPILETRHGIPTMYAGHQFRSRLESRWAAFFDVCGWPWVYEPFDLAGWIPDFLIGDVLVEIKPFRRLIEFYEAIRKAQAAMQDNPRELLLLGVAPFAFGEQTVIGWLGEFVETPPPIWDYQPAILGDSDSRFDFCHDTGSWSGRVFGAPKSARVPVRQAWNLWGEACNRTQWRPPS